MSDAPEKDAGKKKGGGKKKLVMILGAVAVLGGGGAAAGFFAAGSMHKESGPVEDPNRPKLVLKGQDPYAVGGVSKESGGGEGGEGGGKAEPASEDGAEPSAPHAPVDLPRPKDPTRYQLTYYQIPAPFTSNMADSDAFAQISIAVSTYYDARVIKAIQDHELAIRSAILMRMAQEQELDLNSPKGKEKLQANLVKIINDTLKANTGYSGVDNVYFTNFVIQ
ncbi:MAG: flagellar basal body-associated FliL family protein [Sphingomonas sp.]|nr:flagellar basal body-associated FliL family protein [Sphingomonas sp.]